MDCNDALKSDQIDLAMFFLSSLKSERNHLYYTMSSYVATKLWEYYAHIERHKQGGVISKNEWNIISGASNTVKRLKEKLFIKRNLKTVDCDTDGGGGSYTCKYKYMAIPVLCDYMTETFETKFSNRTQMKHWCLVIIDFSRHLEKNYIQVEFYDSLKESEEQYFIPWKQVIFRWLMECLEIPSMHEYTTKTSKETHIDTYLTSIRQSISVNSTTPVDVISIDESSNSSDSWDSMRSSDIKMRENCIQSGCGSVKSDVIREPIHDGEQHNHQKKRKLSDDNYHIIIPKKMKHVHHLKHNEDGTSSTCVANDHVLNISYKIMKGQKIHQSHSLNCGFFVCLYYHLRLIGRNIDEIDESDCCSEEYIDEKYKILLKKKALDNREMIERYETISLIANNTNESLAVQDTSTVITIE